MSERGKGGDLPRLLSMARLQISEQQMLEMQGVLDGILSWISAISEVEITDVSPMHNPLDEIAWVGPGFTEVRLASAKSSLSNSACATDGFFVVPDALQDS